MNNEHTPNSIKQCVCQMFDMSLWRTKRVLWYYLITSTHGLTTWDTNLSDMCMPILILRIYWACCGKKFSCHSLFFFIVFHHANIVLKRSKKFDIEPFFLLIFHYLSYYKLMAKSHLPIFWNYLAFYFWVRTTFVYCQCMISSFIFFSFCF